MLLKLIRRYREFEYLNRNLNREGIRPSAALPSKKFIASFGITKPDLALDSRRKGLEQYLQSALEAVVHSANPVAMEIAARFLDDDYDSLIL
jgi:PX domain